MKQHSYKPTRRSKRNRPHLKRIEVSAKTVRTVFSVYSSRVSYKSDSLFADDIGGRASSEDEVSQ
jgi:hypothetical protein